MNQSPKGRKACIPGSILGECRDMLAGNPSPEAISTVRAMLAGAESSHAGLVGALAFYAKEANWEEGALPSAAYLDAGDKARAALSGQQGDKSPIMPRPIQIGDTYLMPKPNESDNWHNAGWVGRVVGFRDGGKLVTVKDMDDEASDIEYDRLAACERA